MRIALQYVVLIEKTNNGYYAYPPDLRNCVAAADTRAEAEEPIREAIVPHLELRRVNPPATDNHLPA